MYTLFFNFYKNIKYKMYSILGDNSFQLTHKKKMHETYNKLTTINLIILFYFFGFIFLVIFYKYFLFNLHLELTFYTYKNKITYFFFYLYNKFFLNFKFLNFLDNIYYFDITNDRIVFFDKINFFIQNLIIMYKYYLDYNFFITINRFNLNFNSIGELARFFFILFLLFLFIGNFYIYLLSTLISYSTVFCFFLFILSFFLNLNNFSILYRLDYVNFLINESFINRNLYVDSNYFLTNDSMRGIEKFSDITSPWLIDFEDFGWGGEFSIQTISKQIIERERRLILENIYIDTTPNMENLNLKPGTLKVRFLKLFRRFEIFSFYLNSYMGERHLVKNIWKKQYFYKNDILSKRALSLNKPAKLHLFPYKLVGDGSIIGNNTFSNFSFKKIMRENIKKLGYTFRMDNDFFLSKKNNILNDVNKSGSNVKNRKEVVFRNVVNQLDTVKNKYGIASRLSDFNSESNYIFERQLQESRILDYQLKKYMVNYFKNRFNFYFQNKLFSEQAVKNFQSFNMFSGFKFNKDLRLFNNLNTKSEQELSSPTFSNLTKKYKSKYLKLDERVENFTKILNSDLKMHYNYDLIDSEFPYLKNETREISGFLDKFGFLDETLVLLLEENKLKLGLHDYANFEKKPWEFTNPVLSDIWKIRYNVKKYPQNSKNKKYFDNFKKIPRYYKYLENKFKNLTFYEKKIIYIKTISQTKPSWFYFNKIQDNYKLYQFFHFIKNEYIVNNHNIWKSKSMDFSIVNFWNSTNYALLSLYYSKPKVFKNFLYKKNNIKTNFIWKNSLYSDYLDFNTLSNKPSPNILYFLYIHIIKRLMFLELFFIKTYPWSFKYWVNVDFKRYVKYGYKKHYKFLYSFYVRTPLKTYDILNLWRIKPSIDKNFNNFLFFIKKHLRTDLEFYNTIFIKIRTKFFYYDNFKYFCIKFFTIKNLYSSSFLFNIKYPSFSIIINLYMKTVSTFIFLFFLFFNFFNYSILNFYFIVNLLKVIQNQFNNFFIINNYFFILNTDFFFNKYSIFNFFLLVYGYIEPMDIELEVYIKLIDYFLNIFIVDMFIFSFNFFFNILTFKNFEYILYFLFYNFLYYFEIWSLLLNKLIVYAIAEYSSFLYFIIFNLFNFLYTINFIFFYNFLNIFFIFELKNFFLEIFIFNFIYFGLLDIIFDILFLNFIEFALSFDIYILYFIIKYGMFLNSLLDHAYNFYIFYLNIFNAYGFSMVLDVLTVNYLKLINLYYVSKFTRIIIYSGGYYSNITMDINDKISKHFSIFFKNFIFFWIKINQRLLFFKAKSDSFVDFRVLENFKTYLRIIIFLKKKYFNFLYFLDIFIFKKIINSLFDFLFKIYNSTVFLFRLFSSYASDFLLNYSQFFFKNKPLSLYTYLLNILLNLKISILFEFLNFISQVSGTKFFKIYDIFLIYFNFTILYYQTYIFSIKYKLLLFLNTIFFKYLNFITFSIPIFSTINLYEFSLFFKKYLEYFYFNCKNLTFSYFFYFIYYKLSLINFVGINYCVYLSLRLLNNFYISVIFFFNLLIYYFYTFIFITSGEFFITIKKYYLFNIYSYFIFYYNYASLLYIDVTQIWQWIGHTLFLFWFQIDDRYIYNLSFYVKQKEIKFNMCYWFFLISFEIFYNSILFKKNLLGGWYFYFLEIFNYFLFCYNSFLNSIYFFIKFLNFNFFLIYNYDIIYFYYFKLKYDFILLDVDCSKKLLNFYNFKLKKKSIKSNYIKLFTFRRGLIKWKYSIFYLWNFNSFKKLHLKLFIHKYRFLKFFGKLTIDTGISNFFSKFYLNFFNQRVYLVKFLKQNFIYKISNSILFKKLKFVILNKLCFIKNKTYFIFFPYQIKNKIIIDFFKFIKIQNIHNLDIQRNSLLLNVLIKLEVLVHLKVNFSFFTDISRIFQSRIKTNLSFAESSKFLKINKKVDNAGLVLRKNNFSFFNFYNIKSEKDFISFFYILKNLHIRHYLYILEKKLNNQWSYFSFWRYFFVDYKFNVNFSKFNDYLKKGGFLFFTPGFKKNPKSTIFQSSIEKSFDFSVKDFNKNLLLNLLNFDSIVNKKVFTDFDIPNTNVFKFLKNNNFNNSSLTTNIVKNTNYNPKNHFKLDYRFSYFKNDPTFYNTIDLFNLKFFYNFFKKIENDYIFKNKIKKEYKFPIYEISYIENLNVNSLNEVSSNTVNFYNIFIVFFNKLVIFLNSLFRFLYTNFKNSTIFKEMLKYYTEFDKKSIKWRFKNLVNQSRTVGTPGKVVYKFGYISDNKLYRYILYKIIYTKPILLDKIQYISFKNFTNIHFNFIFKQDFKNIALNTLYSLSKTLLCAFELKNRDITFWLTQINLHILYCYCSVILECWFLCKSTKVLLYLLNFYNDLFFKNLIILKTWERVDYFINYQFNSIISNYTNFIDTFVYNDLFLEDLIKFQLVFQNNIFSSIIRTRDIHEVDNRNLNQILSDKRKGRRNSVVDSYVRKYIWFRLKNDFILDVNIFFFIKIFNYVCIYFENYFQFLNLFFLNLFFDLKSNYLEFNFIFYKKYLDLFLEIIEIYDEVFKCWWEHFVQNLLQTVWLEVTIYFDFIFEYFTEVDYELEDSPFSLFFEEFFNVIISFLRGSPFYEIDISNFDLSEWSGNKTSSSENDNFHGFSDIDVDDSLGFLGWGFNNNLGSNPGNEFSTLNDISEIPEFLEKVLLFDVNDFYNNIFGLDDPQLGNLQPSFDISLPLKSLWVLGAIYYDPRWGGAAVIDFNALVSFLKILYIDRRTFLLNNVFIFIDFVTYNDNLPGILFLKFKILYTYYDILQFFDLVYFSIFDILHFWLFYIIYIFEILGIFLIFSTFILFVIFLKLNNIFEKKERIFSRNSNNFNFLFYNFWNYTFFRYIYLILSNLILFLKMSISLLVILTFIYIFSEGLHILSVLRVFDVSQESTLFLNGQYFILERDPFVEKNNPIDEMLDNFKYESDIDDEWSRTHFNRETTEIIGGPKKEQGSVIDILGFSKKLNLDYDIEDNMEEIDSTPALDSRSVIDQIHNNIVDEYTFMPSFYQSSVLEREFFRESETFGEEIEGSLDYLNRSESRIHNIWLDFNFEEMHDDQNLQGSLEFEEDMNLWDSDFYGALLLNMADPKWLYNYSPSLTARELTPHIIGNNQTQLYSNNLNNKFHQYEKLNTNLVAQNRIINLLNRNKGQVLYNPILDFYDEDESVDFGLDINEEYGTSIGSVSNLLDNWDDHTADPVTQLTKHSSNPSIADTILFNYTSTDDILPPNYYSGEDLIFENFFDTVFNTRLFGFEKINAPEVMDDSYDDEANYEEIDSDSYDNFFPKAGRFSIIEYNYKNKNFVSDNMPEGYFNLTSYVFKDLNKNIKNIVSDNSFSSINLENIRKRDLAFKKIEGSKPLNIFYDEMVSDDLDKLIYFNLENTNANWGNTSFYKKNEFSQKMDLTQKNIWWVPSGNEYRALYFDEFQYGSMNPYAEHLNENDFDLVDFLRSENQEEWFVPDIFHDKISQLKSVIKKRKWKPQRELTKKFSSIYNNINNDWYVAKPAHKNKVNKNLSNKYKFKLLSKNCNSENQHNFFKFNNINSNINYLKYKITNKPKFYETTHDTSKNFNKFAKINKDLISFFINKKIKIADNLYFTPDLDEKSKSIFYTKFFFDRSQTFIVENKENSINYTDFLNTTKKLKPGLTSFLKNNNFKKQMLEPIQKQINYTLNSDNFSNSDYSNEIYNSKIEQYLNSFEYDDVLLKNNNFNNDDKLEDLSDYIFFNNKWSIDHTGKVHYGLFKNKDIFNLNNLFTRLKNSTGSIKNYLELINKNITSSSKVREFAANPDRGYWSELKDEISQDERLTGILNPKIIENPIFLNDSEAFKEFSEMWNIDFGRKDNNLDILGMGQPRELALYDHYSNDPDFSPIRREIPIITERSDDYDDADDVDFFGIDDSNYEVEDRLRAGESWYGFNFDIGKNWHKYRLANFSKLIENELLSDNYNSKVNWFNFEKFGLKQKSKNFKMPWGLDITTKFNFSGSQNWNFQKNDENLIKLITLGNFKIFNNDISATDEFTKQKINFQNLKKNTNFLYKSDFGNKNFYLSLDDTKKNNKIFNLNNYNTNFNLYSKNELNDVNFSGLDLDLSFDKKIKFLKNIKNKENTNIYNNSYNFEMLQDNINTTTFSIDYDPDELRVNIDRNWDVDLKFDYTTKFYQYGKMFRSLNQSNLILEHFKSNIALDNIAITPDQSSDYFWYTYKKYKNNKFDNFFKKINYSRDIPTQNKILKLNFENFIKSPISDNIKSTATFEEFNNYTEDNLFPNLYDSWDSGYLDLKLGYRSTDDSIPTKDYELFDIDDFEYQHLNSNNSWVSRNKKIKNVIKPARSKFLKNELYIKKDKNDMDTLYFMAENVSNSISSNNIWWSLDINSKFKNIKQSKEAYLFDNLFGLYVQKWKKSYNILREKNAQIRQKQIDNVLFNNIKIPEINYNFSKFWLKFSKNENLINAITNLIKIKNIQIHGDMVYDTQDIDNNQDFDIFENEKNLNLFNDELEYSDNFENLPYFLNNPVNADIILKNFNVRSSNNTGISDFFENMFSENYEFSNLNKNLEFTNRNQSLLVYLKNKKYKNILNSNNYNNNFKLNYFNNANIQEIQDFDEINSLSFEYNKFNENTTNYNRWTLNAYKNNYNTGNYFNTNILGNSTENDDYANSEYSFLESFNKLSINNETSSENDFEDTSLNFKELSDMDNNVFEYGPDLQYFNNKKINTFKGLGVDFKGNGTVRPFNFNNLNLEINPVLGDSQVYNLSTFSEFDEDFLEAEDSTIFQTSIYYKKELPKFKLIPKKRSTDYNNLFKKQIQNSLSTFNKNLVYIEKPKKILNNFNKLSTINIKNTLDTIPNSLNLDNFLITNQKSKPGTYDPLFLKNKKINNSLVPSLNLKSLSYSSDILFNRENKNTFKNIWKKKNKIPYLDNYLDYDLGSGDSINFIKKLNKGSLSLKNSLNYLPHNIYINKNSKIDSIFGNSRFFNFENDIYNLTKPSSKFLFKNFKNLNNKQLTKSDNFGYIKNELYLKNYTKNINGFYSNYFNNNSIADVDYITSVSLPIYKNLKIKENNQGSQYFIFNNKENIVFDNFKYVESEIKDNSKFNTLLKWNSNRKIGSMLKTSYQHINEKNEKTSNLFRNFSYTESIYPLPIIKSLSINSNLFNKINSLRIYGAGRLSDYFYNTKLKHLLSSNKQNIDFDDDDDIEYDDDTFLLDFDEGDENDYWYQDLDSEDILLSEDDENFVVNLNNSSFNQREPVLLENFDDIDDFFINFSNKDNNFNFDSEDRLFDNSIEELDDYDAIVEQEMEIDTNSVIENKNILENFKWHFLQSFLNKNNSISNFNFYRNNEINNSTSNEIFSLNSQLPHLSNYDDLEEFSNNYNTVENLNLKKIPISKKVNKLKFYNNYESSFDDLLITTFENLIDNVSDFSLLENLEQSDFNNTNNLIEISENSENFKDIVQFSDKQNIYSLGQFYENINSNILVNNSEIVTNNNVSFSDQFGILDSDDLDLSILSNITTEEDLDDDFNDNEEDFEDITNFMSKRFLFYEIPSEKLDSSEIGLNYTSLNTANLLNNYLNTRKDKYFYTNNKNFYKKKSNKNNIFIEYSLDKDSRFDLKTSNFVNINQNVLESNWFLNRTYWSDTLDDFEDSDLELHGFSEDSEDEYSSFEKIQNSVNLEDTETLLGISDYLLNNKLFLSYNTNGNDTLDKNTKISGTDYDFFENLELNPIINSNEFFSSWNLTNSIDTDANWKLKNKKNINLKNFYEKNSNLQVKEFLSRFNSDYIFTHNLLNLKIKNKNSFQNLSILLRKINSNNSGNFGIKKFINLKKKYWNRLDIIEKYLNSIKNSLLFKNKNKLNTNITNKDSTNLNTKINMFLNKKPMQVDISHFIKFLYKLQYKNSSNNLFSLDSNVYSKNLEYIYDINFNKNIDINLINFSKNFNSNIYNKIFVDSIEKKWKNTINTNTEKNNLIKNIYKYENFYNNFSKDLINTTYSQNLINDDTFFNENSEYLGFKLENLKKKIDFEEIYDENINDPVEVFDDSVLEEDDDDIDEIFDIYSKLRNDLQKLDSNKYGNNYLTPSVPATLISTLSNYSLFNYISEVPKNTNFYKNISTYENNINFPNNSFESFLDKETKRSIRRLNNIKYFKKSPVIDQFTIFHKKLQRPGLDLNNPYSTIPIDPFKQFKSNSELYDRSLKYGSGDYVFKNSPVSRRSYDLAFRTFGPDIITNSTLLGYGRIDFISDLNQDDEEDSGINDNLGYPVINEQNIYNYDYPDIVDTYNTDSIFSIDFLDFMWDIEDEDDIGNINSEYYDGYDSFFELTDNYERLPLFSIFLPKNINLKQDFNIFNIKTWSNFSDPVEFLLPESNFFNLNVSDLEDGEDFTDILDEYEEDEDDFEDSLDMGDAEPEFFNNNEDDNFLDNDIVDSFYKDLSSMNIFDITPLGLTSTLKWLDYFEGESIDNASFDDEDENDEDEGMEMSPLTFIYSMLIDPDENDITDENNLPKGFIEPAFNSRYFQTWNTSQNLYYEPRPEIETLEDDSADDSVFDLYGDTINYDLTEEEDLGKQPVVYRFPHYRTTPYDIISKLKTETELEWYVPSKLFSKGNRNHWKNEVENELTEKVYTDSWDQNIGPLGYEEGDTIFENRMLNRGWYPEKIVWNWGIRDQSRIGNDLTTLELLSDYSTSFSHGEEHFGNDPDDEALLSLSWAGKNNKLFNLIDDIVEGIGIEEDIPFSPETARKLWEYEEHEERQTYEEDVAADIWHFNEDDDEDYYTNYNDPGTFYHYKDELFNTLGYLRYESESDSWEKTNYLGNLDSTMISGSSMALSNNVFYDGLMTDFSNFIYEKFPIDPKNNTINSTLPYTTENLFSIGDFDDSPIPGFADYIIDINDEDEDDDEEDEDEDESIEKEENYNLLETFKPKDCFNFSPDDSSFLTFEPEWIVNGEGWLGNTGSGLKIFDKENISNKYLNPELEYFSSPGGIHSFELLNDEDQNLGFDAPYFSLTDFQKNRIIRGRDNDISNFPIKTGWNLVTGFTPEWHNLFWKHRVRFGDANESVLFDLDSFEYQITNSGAASKTGIGIPFSDTLSDNPDFIVFSDIEINQRNLWWKSISGGYLNDRSKFELSVGTSIDNKDSYRDFLLSYDYRIFGKSWLNPQNTTMPLKSFNFYGDSQINDWLSNSNDMDSNSYQQLKDNYSLFDYTYGHFVNSQTNFDANLTYFSINLRNFLYKIYHMVVFYFSYIVFSVSSFSKHIVYYFFDFIFFKIELCYVLLTFFNYFDVNTFSVLFNFLNKLFNLFKKLINILINTFLFFELFFITLLNISIFDFQVIFINIKLNLKFLIIFFKNIIDLVILKFTFTNFLFYLYFFFFLLLILVF